MKQTILLFALLNGCSILGLKVDPYLLDSGILNSDDGDNDGFSISNGDCDDDDANTSPSAVDLVGDSIDQNCDGLSDFDQDGDGYRWVCQ